MSDRDHLWQDAARQAGGERLVDLLRDMQETQSAMLGRISELEELVKKHIGIAFPGADPEGHRRAHEAMIERTAELRRLRAAIIEKSIAGLVWAGLVAAGLMFVEWLKSTLRG